MLYKKKWSFTAVYGFLQLCELDRLHRLCDLCFSNKCSGVLASLNTTASSRSKHSSVPSKIEDERLVKPNTKSQSTNESKQKLGSKHIEKGNSGGKIEHDPWHTQFT